MSSTNIIVANNIFVLGSKHTKSTNQPTISNFSLNNIISFCTFIQEISSAPLSNDLIRSAPLN